jgi:hypothetical protein
MEFDPEDDDDDLGGYALVTERRIVDLPPGEVIVRFEGVASGIQPQTMILTGLTPQEKNQDRLLLSKRGLLDAFTGQRVTVRRTDKATGKATEEPARIRSGPDGVILETKAGFEALDCTGLNEMLVFPRVPPSLSPKPVLSVTVPNQPGGRRELILSYLTGNFDWQANYVVDLSADSTRIDLFAWVTLASLDDTSFDQAQAGVVAGRVARAKDEEGYEHRDDDEDDEEKYWIDSKCWPAGTTGGGSHSRHYLDLPELRKPSAERELDNYYGGGGGDEESIVVTGSRIVRQENLGDLKLYRVPFPVTVAPRAQKQVAMLSKRGIKGDLLYRSRGGNDPELIFRFRNRKEDGLGEPLPTGQVSMFQTAGGRRLLLGETYIDNKAVGEEVELRFPEQDEMNVDVESDEEKEGKDWTRYRLTVTNANPWPIVYEAEFRDDEETRYDRFSGRVVRKLGKTVWRTTVPANGKASLRYREVEIDVPDYSDDD